MDSGRAEEVSGFVVKQAQFVLGFFQHRLALGRQILACAVEIERQHRHGRTKEADVSVITIKRLEAAEDELPGRYETVMKVKRAVEKAGVEFLGGGDRIGVVRAHKGRKR